MLMRFRRYRVFLVFAVLITIFIVRLSQRKSWPDYPHAAGLEKGTEGSDGKPLWTPRPQGGERLIEPEKPMLEKPVLGRQTTSTALPKTKPNAEAATPAAAPAVTPPTVPKVVLPDKKKPEPATDPYSGDVYDTDVDDIHPVSPPGRQEKEDLPAESTTIHWQKQVEHFPVATESIIQIPTGKPVAIPKIQHAFEDETSDAKRTREKRQTLVKEEFRKAWGGYKKYAWLHDELSPVSGKFRDPFCGWAATLVDTLDTLWILGLEEEFEEAAKAVDLIDFTTSSRNDIPVFETTIRYMGGLLAAYDVSGAKYKNLLDKAVELGDILLGAFDTPNRMPILYYYWKPAFASQPHRASQRSNLAELGSLSMEFTRLAQLTHNPRYYDAVARVTNALEEWQDRGTKLGNVFPGDVDASGCNRSVEYTSQQPIAPPAVVPSEEEEKGLGYQTSSPETVAEPRKKGIKESPSGPGTLQVQFMPGEPGKASIKDWDSTNKTPKRDLDGELVARSPPVNPVSGFPARSGAVNTKGDEDWDCKPQGLEPGNSNEYSADRFGMGGGQDSTYEYFSKQFLLLGGLQDQYRKMYLKTVEDIRKWMLFRPMVPGDLDILFSASVKTKGKPEKDLVLEPEVTHLTCFIGGMIGMGAKIFGLESDLELAKKLTEGCVWAYESMPTGVMAEESVVVPCQSAEHCTWNATLYDQELDPIWETRDLNVEEYKVNKKAVDIELAANAKAAAEKKAAEKAKALESGPDPEAGVGLANGNATASLKKPGPVSLQKRQLDPLASSPKLEVPKPITHNFKDGSSAKKSEPKPATPPEPLTPTEEFYQQKAEVTDASLYDLATGGRSDEIPHDGLEPIPRDPSMPFTHKEYVENKIKQETLVPGYVSYKARKYILRPEAIESVWYMYRITGDTTWQDKGWNMFESIINTTSTKYGHTAIFDVTVPRNQTLQIDEMESFWLAETLKYFYLLYSTPDTISLDEWVLNTEAHPFKRPS
ncbi:Endoplasmic reticulum mannosyl-oligosaccharide 1,2-alpha-mannosidase [Lachnellula suecica]|uniref:alpha-1,2-Mannosidase n=1 Tax=Lachnellula suecica TaxID=602035 RepID=A0A8T9C1R8_9HELO|nr:Endoplasmic reticulum mannosyl-oligosaccharide 1,2-alpha-mannosidase [Lachnellula suecica]